VAALALGLAAAGLLSTPALASPETLKRSLQNITLAPLDLVTAPLAAGKSEWTNLHDIDDTPAVRYAYAVPGFFWNTAMQIGASALREVAGLIELAPGVGLLFSDADLDPLFDPAEENEALVDVESPVFNVRFGIDYTTPPL